MKNAFMHAGGKPFFSIGGQVNNSTGYDAQKMEHACRTAELAGLDTIAVPVYWETLEPAEGQFDFAQADMVLDTARRHGLYLVVLWFGTWKNGNSHYVPEWLKTDRDRFFWCRTADGTPVRTLSPSCENTREADKKAFSALCAHLAAADAERRILAVQVENEPGIIGSARDYGPEASREFDGPVPEAAARLTQKQGTWREVYGFDAAEFFTAWKIATYIEQVAAAGKRQLDRPMYTNVWLGEMHSRIAGVDYPSGGAVCKTLPLFRLGAPSLDTISPDIYLQDAAVWAQLNRAYADGVHPYYIPELLPTALAATEAIQAVTEYGLSGVHFFGIDTLSGPDGSILPPFSEAVEALRTLRSMKPLITQYQGTGRLYAVCQYEGLSEQYMDFGDYIGSVRFDNRNGDLLAKNTDKTRDNTHAFQPFGEQRGKGLICYAGRGEFYLAGSGWRLMLYPKSGIEAATNAAHSADFLNQRCQAFLSVTEGAFDADGRYTARVRRNGDEADYGFWVTPDVGVVRVRMDADFC